MTNSSGSVTEQTAYDSFGNATTNFSTRYQFTGREFDNFTGLHYYRARWYDANLGRFISEDPIGFAGGINLYGYVGNKPLSFVDPFGYDEYAMMERLTNPQPLNRSIDEILDDLQLQLGSLGLAPGVGEPADALDGLISLARGNYGDAALSGGSMIPFLGTGAGVTKVCNKLEKLQSKLDNLAETNLLSKFREIDPNLKAGYTGSFKTGIVGNPNKPTFGQPIDLKDYDIDYWIESDVLHKQYGSNKKANPEFRKLLSNTPGFKGLRPNKNGFSIKFKPSR